MHAVMLGLFCPLFGLLAVVGEEAAAQTGPGPNDAVSCPGSPLDGRTRVVVEHILELLPVDLPACSTVTDLQLASLFLLDISSENLTTLRAGDFDGLMGLGFLSLKGNALQSLPQGVFAGTPNLAVLDLSGNQLTSSGLPAGTFSGLSSTLGVLYLSDNPLTSLPANVFTGLSKLAGLYLEDNQLTALPAGAFTGLSELKILHLTDNRLTALPAGVFTGLSKLENLHLHGNRLTALPAGVFAGLSKLENLHLHDNELQSLPVNVFADLSELQNLYLTNNQLTTLLTGVFTGLSSLNNLYLPNNQLANLEENVFAGLSNLTDLLLQNNRLTSLPERAFAGLSNLTNLFLNSNRLTHLPAGAFTGLSGLEILDLSDNRLANLPAGGFTDLSSLQELRLSNNLLTSVPENVFAGLSSLGHLNLAVNQLASVPAGVFSGLSNLEELRLSSNPLTSLSAGLFQGLESIQRLYLDNMQLTTLPEKMFGGLSNLEQLELSRNPIGNLEPAYFQPQSLDSLIALLFGDTEPSAEELEAYKQVLPELLLLGLAGLSPEEPQEEPQEEPPAPAKDNGKITRSILPRVSLAIMDWNVEAVDERISTGTASSSTNAFRLAGQSMLLDALIVEGASWQKGIDLKELLGASSFSLTSNSGAGSNSVTLWGKGHYRKLSGDDEMVDWDGQIYGAQLGVDTWLDRHWLVGVLLGWSEGQFDWADRGVSDEGDYDMDMTSGHLYTGWSSPDGAMQLWGVVGYGSGKVEIESQDSNTGKQSSDSHMRSAALGVSGTLLSSDTVLGGGKTMLRAKGQYSVVQVEVEEREFFNELTVNTRRLRAALEATHEQDLGEGRLLTPSIEVGIRSDGGDGDNDSSLETGLGLHYLDRLRGLVLDGRINTLVAASDNEWGASIAISVDPGMPRRGASFSLTSDYGMLGREAGWLQEPTVTSLPEDALVPTGRLDAELRYGMLSPGSTDLFTLYSGLTLSGSKNQRLRLGGRLELDAQSDVHLEVVHLQPDSESAKYGVRMEARLRF